MPNQILSHPPDIEAQGVETAQSVSCPIFAQIVGVDVRTVRKLTKLKDSRLRPPGFKVGKQYRIWVSELADYLHGYGRYEGAGFAAAMERVNQ